MSVSREELRKLPLAERLELVQDLWDSIAGDSEQLALTQAQMDELDRRFADYEANPDEGIAWKTCVTGPGHAVEPSRHLSSCWLVCTRVVIWSGRRNIHGALLHRV